MAHDIKLCWDKSLLFQRFNSLFHQRQIPDKQKPSVFLTAVAMLYKDILYVYYVLDTMYTMYSIQIYLDIYVYIHIDELPNTVEPIKFEIKRLFNPNRNFRPRIILPHLSVSIDDTYSYHARR